MIFTPDRIPGPIPGSEPFDQPSSRTLDIANEL